MKAPENELWLGDRRAQGTGVRIPLEVDVYGRTVIFWSHGVRGACPPCAAGSYAAWRGHLRGGSQVRRLPDGATQTRIIAHCPVRNPRPAWADPVWRTALA